MQADDSIDEEELSKRVVDLFSEYRRIDEVVFDIPKSTKNEQLGDIRRELNQLIETATTLYEATIPKSHETDEDIIHADRLTRETSMSREDFEPSASFEFRDENSLVSGNAVDAKQAEPEEELPTSIFTAGLMNYWKGHLMFLEELSGDKKPPSKPRKNTSSSSNSKSNNNSGSNNNRRNNNSSSSSKSKGGGTTTSATTSSSSSDPAATTSSSNLSPDDAKRSEEMTVPILLEKAVKLEPSNVCTWNTLGEYYNHMGDLEAARSCFENALRHDANNKISYVNLCRILRQRPYAVAQQMQQEPSVAAAAAAAAAHQRRGGGRHGKHKIPEPPANLVNQQLRRNLEISLELATTGLRMAEGGFNDGELWFNLGNAYLHSFANRYRNLCGMNGEMDGEKGDFHKAETAYRHAMNAKIYSHANHPDLHFNLHVMRVFQCNYVEAFVELKLAIQFGDEQVSAREEARRLTQQIIQYYKSLTTHRGKAANRLREDVKLIAKKLSDVTQPVLELGFNPIRISDLTDDLNGGQALVLKCMSVLSFESSPFYLSCCDGDGTCCIFALYMTERPFAQQILSLCDVPESNLISTSDTDGSLRQSLLTITNPVAKRVHNIDFNSVLEGTPYATSRFPSVDYWIVTFRDPTDLFINERRLQGSD